MPYKDYQQRLKASREYYYRNREHINKQRKQWRMEHPEILSARSKAVYRKYKEKYKDKRRQYYLEHRAEILASNRRWRKNNAERLKEYCKERTRKGLNAARKRRQRLRNPEKYNAKRRAYYARNSEYICQLRRYEWLAKMELFAQDAEAYAAYRRKKRVERAKRRVRGGKQYHPHLAKRVPDYLPRRENYIDSALIIPERIASNRRNRIPEETPLLLNSANLRRKAKIRNFKEHGK